MDTEGLSLCFQSGSMAEKWPDEIRVPVAICTSKQSSEAEGASLGKCQEENQGLKERGTKFTCKGCHLFLMVNFQIK